MADKKISQLTGATTPLAGTEVLPIVQGGSTVKVAVSDLTAGRAVSATGLTLTSTPLAVTSGGTGTATAFTPGSVVFAGASGVYSQSNANLFWDNANNRLGIKTASPGYALDVVDNTTGVQGRISSSSSNGTSFAMTNSAANGRTWRIGNNYVIGNGEWSLYDDTASKEVLRADSSQNVRVVQGNFIVGTAAKGIDFSANTHAAGMTSELLNWYEEGTWTPTVNGASGTTYTTQNGWYTRIGNLVTVGFELTINAAGTIAGGASIAGLPFTSAATYKSSGSLSFAGTVVTSTVWQGLVIGASQSVLTVYIKTAASASTTSINGSDFFGAGTQLIGLLTYRV